MQHMKYKILLDLVISAVWKVTKHSAVEYNIPQRQAQRFQATQTSTYSLVIEINLKELMGNLW